MRWIPHASAAEGHLTAPTPRLDNGRSNLVSVRVSQGACEVADYSHCGIPQVGVTPVGCGAAEAMRSEAFRGLGDRGPNVGHGADDAIRNGGSAYCLAIRLRLHRSLYPDGVVVALEQSLLLPNRSTKGKADGVAAVHGAGDTLQAVAPEVVGVAQYDQFRELRCIGAS